MSTLHNSLRRLGEWAYRRRLTLLVGALVLGFAVTMFVTTFRIYDERQERLAAIEELAQRTADNAEGNRQRALEQCEATNGTNSTVRFILGAGLRVRAPDNPISPELRQAYIDAYQRMPHTDCATGAKTYFDPPFQPGHVPPE